MDLPMTLQNFKDMNTLLTNETVKKNRRKLIDMVATAKRAIPPKDIVYAINQIQDTLLRAKVAGLVAFDMGDEKHQPGIYDALDMIIREYPKNCDNEPAQEDVCRALIDLGYSIKQATAMSTPPKED